MASLSLSIQFATAQTPLPSRSQLRRWVKAAIRADTALAIRIVDEAEARLLSGTYRGKDYATNMLTFPLAETPAPIGDIVICAPMRQNTTAVCGQDKLNLSEISTQKTQ